MSVYSLSNVEWKVYSGIYTALQRLDVHAKIPAIDLKSALDIYRKALSESSHGYMYNQNQIRMRSGFRENEIEFDMCGEFKNGRIRTDMRIIPEIADVITAARKEKNTYEQMKSVYAYFVKNFEYAYDQADDLKYHSAISVFLRRKSVCEGFAMAMSAVLNRMGVSCGIITGQSSMSGANGAHAWNIAELDGKYYHLDVTWDICTKRTEADIFDYFLLDDRLAGKNHQWCDASIPRATDPTKEFYAYNGLLCKTEQDCKNVLILGMKQKRTNMGFRFVGSGNRNVNSEDAQRIFELAMREGHFTYRSYLFSVNKEGGTVHYSVNY